MRLTAINRLTALKREVVDMKLQSYLQSTECSKGTTKIKCYPNFS